MSKLLRNPTTGKLIRIANGKLKRGNAGDPCCCAATCQYCPTAGPATLYLNISATEPNGTCLRLGVSASYKWVDMAIDGEYALTQTEADPCIWRSADTDFGDMYRWFNLTCAGTPIVHSLGHFEVTIQADAIRVDFFYGSISQPVAKNLAPIENVDCDIEQSGDFGYFEYTEADPLNYVDMGSYTLSANPFP